MAARFVSHPLGGHEMLWWCGEYTGQLHPLASRRSVFVLAASCCSSADSRVFASAGAAIRMDTHSPHPKALRHTLAVASVGYPVTFEAADALPGR